MNDGGRAFPLAVTSVQGEGLAFSDNDKDSNGGMSLRDYFAAKAMQGIITGINTSTEHNIVFSDAARNEGISQYEFVSRYSYQIADAMLEARKSQKEKV